jgi:hypothetical protein
MNRGICVRGKNQRRYLAATVAIIYAVSFAPGADGYAFNEIVPDVRQPASISGGSACPVRSHFHSNGAPRSVRWSTALGSSPVTIVTQDQTSSGRLSEIEQVITQSFAVWSGVSGSALQSVETSLTRTPTQSACGSDGVNSICFDQADFAFTPGVLAFTRVIVADAVGVQVGSGAPAVEVGEILDADIYFNPSDSSTSYATPLALPSSTRSYDLQSLLIHEIGHSLGFSHSAIWSAMMFPFAPVPGTFSGERRSISQPDAPLGDDDRTGLRVLYPEASDNSAHWHNPRANRECHSSFAAALSARCYWSFRLASGGVGRRQRCGGGRHDWRMELQRSRAGAIRWLVSPRAGAGWPPLSGLRRASERSRGPIADR